MAQEPEDVCENCPRREIRLRARRAPGSADWRMAGRVMDLYSVFPFWGQANPWHRSPKVCARIARAGKFARPAAARQAAPTLAHGGLRRKPAILAHPQNLQSFLFGRQRAPANTMCTPTPGGGMCKNCQGQKMQSAILALTENLPLHSRVVDGGFQASGRVERQVS